MLLWVRKEGQRESGFLVLGYLWNLSDLTFSWIL